MGELPGLVMLLLVGFAVLLLAGSVVLARQVLRPPRRTAGYAVAWGLPVDPGAAGLEFDEWVLQRPGTTLPVWEIATGLEGPTVVMAHGWGRSRIDMLARLRPWAELCSRIVLLDQRGHGDSGPARCALGRAEAADLRALLEGLGAAPVLLAGRSMGAVVAIAAAADAPPEMVAGVVAYAPFIDFHESLRGRLAAQGMPARPFTDLAMLWLRLAGVRRPDTLADASRLRCPLLVIHGTDDPISPIEHGRRIAAAAPEATLHVVEGAGHADLEETDPAGHHDVIRRFAERCVRPRRARAALPVRAPGV